LASEVIIIILKIKAIMKKTKTFPVINFYLKNNLFSLIPAPIFGHVGDGNFHTMLLFEPDNVAEYKLCKDVYRKMGLRALAMGGTCTGEHGIGTGNKQFNEDF
jgi:D-lactate dehydrogenase (cytochrome)